MRKFVSLIAAVSLAMSAGVFAQAADRTAAEPDVYVDGSKILFNDQKAEIIDDVTLVPARGVFEAMGNKVDWDGDERTVTVTSETGVRYVVITIDSDVMRISTYKSLFERKDESYTLEVPAQIINDRTMIPLRAVSEAFDCDVQWDGEEYAVRITTSEPLLLEQNGLSGGTTATAAPTTEPDATAAPDATASPEVQPTAAPAAVTSGKLTVTLSAESDTVSAGDTFYAYVNVENMPANSFISALTATFKYDKTELEYIEGSGVLLGDDEQPIEASVSVDNTEYDGGTKVVYINIDETTGHKKDGKVYRMTFKKLADGAADVALSNNYDTSRGYETSILCTTLTDADGNSQDVEYEGKTATVDTSALTIN